MKTLITSIALVSVLVASATTGSAKPASTDLVIVNGQLVGQDPDANIRGALMRDPYPVGE